MEENLNTAEEFASSESFIAYHLKSDETAIAYWEKWISLHPEKIDEVLTAERMLDVLHVHLPQDERDEERKRLSDFISRSTKESVTTSITPAERRLIPFRTIQIAAAITVIVSATLLYISPAKWFSTQQSDLEWASFTSPKAQRSTIRLSDGSSVTLNSGSTLTYPKSFKAENRIVKLSGQAFFDVKHDSNHPFIVATGKLNTRVLGTAFTVSNYSGEPDISVALLRGSVKVVTTSNQPDSLLLKPGERMSYNASSGKMSKSAFDAVTETGWKDGITAFKGADFETIAKTFARNYGLKLVTEDPLKKLSYTGSYKNDDPLRIIRVICYSLNMTYTVKDKTIMLSPIND